MNKVRKDPPRRWTRLRRTASHIEWAPVILLIVAGSLTWGFVELADEVTEGDTASIDESILLAMRSANDPTDPLGPRWLEEIGRDMTALGGIAVLVLLTSSVIIFVWTLGGRRASVAILIAVIGALLLSFALKSFYSRPRPQLVPHGSHVYSHSFPSGHAMLSAATYLTLGMFLARMVARRQLQFLAVGLAMTITVAVGVSRVYLGVHWPSDVLAGWALGATWALLCWVVVGWLQRRGELEREVDTK
jgi:undecaprenyl-diphosphatase